MQASGFTSRSNLLAEYLGVWVELRVASSTVHFVEYVRFCLAEYIWCDALCVEIIVY